MRRAVVLMVLAACGCDDIVVLEVPSPAKSFLWAIRDGGETTFHAASAERFSQILPRRTTSARVQVMGFDVALGEIALAEGVVRSSARTGGNEPLPPAVYLGEGAYDDTHVEALVPVAEAWPELASFRVDLPGPRCPDISVDTATLTVSSTEAGAMAALGGGRVIAGYGPGDYFVGTRASDMRRLRGPFAPTAMAAIDASTVVIANAHGEVVTATIGEHELFVVTSSAVSARRLPFHYLLVADGVIWAFGVDLLLMKHESDQTGWVEAHPFPHTTDLVPFFGGITREEDRTIIALHAKLFIQLDEGIASQRKVPIVSASVFSEKLRETVIADRTGDLPRQLRLFAASDFDATLAELRGDTQEMASLEENLWLTEVSGAVVTVVLGRNRVCVPPIGPARHVVRAAFDTAALASVPANGAVNVRFVRELSAL